MSKLDLIPKLSPGTKPRAFVFAEYRRESAIPPADRSVIVGQAWFCYAGSRRVVETVEPPYPLMPRKTYVVDYCGAPPGVRCSCGSQFAGHDPGDEDPDQGRAPCRTRASRRP